MQLFKEVRRHKPSVIYIPNVDIWYETVSPSVIRTFTGLLRSLPSSEPVLVLGTMEMMSTEKTKPNATMLRDLFGFSSKNQYELTRPDEVSPHHVFSFLSSELTEAQSARFEFFGEILEYVRTPPTSFPDPENRKKRDIPQLEVAPAPKALEGPSKDELKSQKKKDRLVLNTLKMLIQPIMDMIRTKHKRFRTPIIDDGQIQYLYDEQNPAMLSTDLGPEQRQQQQLFRPYELAKDSKGVPGLIEATSGKFYYNLDSVMIEKRLSNGYYKRPKDFVADIKRLAQDARTSGDAERTLKANEMLTNVEVDIAHIEANNPGLAPECEAVYARERQRERVMVEKARGAAEAGEPVSQLLSNVPHGNSTAEQSSGPVLLGEQIPGAPTLPPVTPVRAIGHDTSLSNGFSASGGHGTGSHQSNGVTVPSRIDDDVHMADSQEPSSLPQERAEFVLPATPSAPNTQTQRSQRSALTHMAHGSQPADYHNSASTTTSGQKTSDRSHQSSGPFNTQSTNGITRGEEHPNFAVIMQIPGGSQLPDTQGMFLPSISSCLVSTADSLTTATEPISGSQLSNSQPSQHSSEPLSGHAAALARHSSFFKSVLNDASTSRPSMPGPANILNPSTSHTLPHTTHASSKALVSAAAATASAMTTSGSRRAPAPPGTLLLDESRLVALHSELVHRSSGLSVEQLQQVGAALLDAVWRVKAEWDRNIVVFALTNAFNNVIQDIETMQKIQPPSQSSDEEDEGEEDVLERVGLSGLGSRGGRSALGYGSERRR